MRLPAPEPIHGTPIVQRGIELSWSASLGPVDPPILCSSGALLSEYKGPIAEYCVGEAVRDDRRNGISGLKEGSGDQYDTIQYDTPRR